MARVFEQDVGGRRTDYQDGSLLCADAVKVLSSIEDGVADIVFLDPPFNLGKKYGGSPASKDRQSEEQYWNFLREVLDEAVRVLKEGGALYLYHLPKWAIKVGAALDGKLEFRHWIAVSMKNGFVGRNVLYPAHYALLFFTKGEANVSRRPNVSPLVCADCGEYARDYGGYRDKIEEKGGVSLSDVWEDLSPVRHPSNKHRNANELTEEIPGRVIAISGIEKGLFVDPFVGSGTSVIKAREAGMLFLASDLDPESYEVTRRRLGESRV